MRTGRVATALIQQRKAPVHRILHKARNAQHRHGQKCILSLRADKTLQACPDSRVLDQLGARRLCASVFGRLSGRAGELRQLKRLRKNPERQRSESARVHASYELNGSSAARCCNCWVAPVWRSISLLVHYHLLMPS